MATDWTLQKTPKLKFDSWVCVKRNNFVVGFNFMDVTDILFHSCGIVRIWVLCWSVSLNRNSEFFFYEGSGRGDLVVEFNFMDVTDILISIAGNVRSWILQWSVSAK